MWMVLGLLAQQGIWMTFVFLAGEGQQIRRART